MGSCALVALSPAFADAGYDNETVVVSASRFEDQARLQQKNAINIVNVQSAQEILKFPDFNAAESLSRMPGISLMSDTGEGRFVMIRGIDGNLNGATYGGVVLLNTNPGGTYQGGGGRAVEFDTVPGGAIDGIIVTKTLTPDHDAEGLGGSIELTPRTAADITAPFLELSACAGTEPLHDHFGPYGGDLAVGFRFGIQDGAVVMERGQSESQVNSGWVSNPTPFSLVLDASYREDKRAIDDLEEDYINDPVKGAKGDYKVWDDLQLRRYDYNRRRFGLGGEFDFKPNDEHRYYLRAADFGYIEAVLKNHLLYNALGGDYPSTLTGGTIVTQSDITLKGTDEEETHRNTVYVAGGEDDFHIVKIDYHVAYSRATYTVNRNYGTTFNGPKGVAVAYDNVDNPNFPAIGVTDGTSLNDPALFKLSKFSNKNESDVDQEWSYAGNATVPVSLLSDTDKLKFGFSVRLRNKWATPTTQTLSVKTKSALSTLSPLAADTTFYHDRYSNGPGINWDALLGQLQNGGIAAGGFALDPSSWFKADEDIYAGYAMYTGDYGPWGFLAGLRVESTVAKYSFYDADINGDNTIYTRNRHAYTDIFPTVQVRYQFSDDLLARATYSSGIGRPGFNQVAQPTSVNTDTNTINIGNPNLKPVTGNDFDLDFEYYLNDGGIVEFGLFDKEFQNYNYSTMIRIYNDPRLDASQPEFEQSSGNLDSSYARGIELAYQQKFTFLPKPLDGFGLEGNFSYVTSSAVLRAGDVGHSLPGTSPTTFNVSLFYEAFGLDLRISSQYTAHSLYQVGGSRAEDQFEDSRFTLDWTSSYDLCENASVYFNVKNITNSPLRIFEGTPSWPIQREFYDQTYEGGVRIKL